MTLSSGETTSPSVFLKLVSTSETEVQDKVLIFRGFEGCRQGPLLFNPRPLSGFREDCAIGGFPRGAGDSVLPSETL